MLEDATVKILAISPFVPTRESFAVGVEDEIPTLPVAVILKSDEVVNPAEVVVEISKRSVVAPDACIIEKRAEGVVVPTAILPV